MFYGVMFIRYINVFVLLIKNFYFVGKFKILFMKYFLLFCLLVMFWAVGCWNVFEEFDILFIGEGDFII